MWYTTIKPFHRKTQGEGNTTVPAGQHLNLELRSEAEAGLRSGALVKGRQIIGKSVDQASVDPRQRAKVSKEDPEELLQIEEIREKLGLPLEGALHKYRALKKTGLTSDEALYELRRSQGILSDEEVIAALAEDMDLDETTLQAELRQYMKEFKLPAGRASRFYRHAAKCGLSFGELMDKLNLLMESKDTTVDDALEFISEAARTDSPQDTPETPPPTTRDGDLTKRVRIKDSDSRFNGQVGTVLSVSSKGRARVKLDGDDGAECRLFSKEQVEPE